MLRRTWRDWTLKVEILLVSGGSDEMGNKVDLIDAKDSDKRLGWVGLKKQMNEEVKRCSTVQGAPPTLIVSNHIRPAMQIFILAPPAGPPGWKILCPAHP